MGRSLSGILRQDPHRPFRALVDARAVLTLAEGLGSRFHQAVSPRGAARNAAWRTAAVVAAGVDLCKAVALARDEDVHLGVRLLADIADLALWTVAAHDDADSSEDAVIPGVALAAEAAARFGPVGFFVPVANAMVAGGIRYHRGHQLRLEQFSWQAMGASGGLMLSVFARRRRAALERQHRNDLQPLLQRAELAGLHDTIIGHEGAVDALQRVTVLVELAAPSSDSRPNFVGAFKASVAEAARAQATYLRETLLLWQTEHNLQPDLGQLVHFVLAPDDGTILLSEAQVRRLHDGLHGLRLVGTVEVRPADPVAARAPGGDRDVIVGGVTVPLARAQTSSAWTFDAIPTAFLMNLGWLIQPVSPQREAVPWTVTVLPVAGTAAATLFSAHRADRRGTVDPLVAVGASFVITALYTVLATRAMRRPHTTEGVSRYPWVMALQGYELVRSLVTDDLQPLERIAALAGTATVVAAGWTLSPRPRSKPALVAELGWVVGFDAFARRLQRAIGDDGRAVAEEICADDAERVDAAYRRGTRHALGIIATAFTDAETRLRERSTQLPPDVRAEARRRLRHVGELLNIDRLQADD